MGIFTVVLLFLVMFAFTGMPFSKGQDVPAFRFVRNVQKAPLLLPLQQRAESQSSLPPDFVMIASMGAPTPEQLNEMAVPIRPMPFSAPLFQNQVETMPLPAASAKSLTRPLAPMALETPEVLMEPMIVQRVSEKTEPLVEAEPIRWARAASRLTAQKSAETLPLEPVSRKPVPAAKEPAAHIAAPPAPKIDPQLVDFIRRLDSLEAVPEAPSITPVPESLFAPRKRLRVVRSNHPISVGRMILNAIQSDKSLSDAVKLTIRVTAADGRVTLHGLVLDARSIAYVESKARRIAGWSTRIDNRLIAIS